MPDIKPSKTFAEPLVSLRVPVDLMDRASAISATSGFKRPDVLRLAIRLGIDEVLERLTTNDGEGEP